MPSRSKDFLTATGGSSSAPGPSIVAGSDAKVKRARKRNRNKKRTADADSDADSDSKISEPKAKVSAATTTKVDSNTESKISDAEQSSDEDDAAEKDDHDGKRKRKRKRPSKKKADTSQIGNGSDTVELGPDPSTDLRLSDQAKQAITYAQLYATDKTQWKFNKARQNWLLRNALSIPPADYEASLARTDPSSHKENGEKANENDEEGETFVPDDFVPVVAAYLKSVLGGARSRLLQSLVEALNAPEVAVAATVETPSAAASSIADRASTTEKSVSFADMAMEQEGSKDETNTAPTQSTEDSGMPPGPDSRTVELKRQRARYVLEKMGETV